MKRTQDVLIKQFGLQHIHKHARTNARTNARTHARMHARTHAQNVLRVCVMVQAGMIPIQMELGGKDACIVCHDADIDLAAKNIVKVHDTALHCR